MNSDKPFVVVTLAFLTLSMIVLLIINWPDVPDQWQSYLCSPEDCTLQQWLSSLAGWFGGLLAAAGAIVVYWQLREQRRQTEFLIGDGEPSVDVVSTAIGEQSACFRIVNWNRRLIVFSSVIFEPAPGVKASWLHRLPDDHNPMTDERPTTFTHSTKIKANGDFWAMPPLPGWEDRSKPPSAAIFVFEYPKGTKPEAFGTDFAQVITLKFEFFTPGDHARNRLVHVRAIRGNAFPRTKEMTEMLDVVDE